MASTCVNCGAEMFRGEQICARCRTPADLSASDIDESPRSPTNGPPPEGIDLVIAKHRSDAEYFREEPLHDREVFDLDDVAEMVRPRRDRHGTIQVDRRHALIGAVVVAIAAGLLYWYVASILTSTSIPLPSSYGG